MASTVNDIDMNYLALHAIVLNETEISTALFFEKNAYVSICFIFICTERIFHNVVIVIFFFYYYLYIYFFYLCLLPR